MAEPIDWPDASGTQYRYWFVDNPSNAIGWKAEPGNYMFVAPGANGWRPVYIGIAENLRNRVPGHEQWAAAVALGATHVMGHTQANTVARETEEKALIAHWNPPLNIQHRRQA